MLFKEPTLYAKKQMPKTTCQKSNERNVNMICQVYNQNTEKVMKKKKKKLRRKVNMYVVQAV